MSENNGHQVIVGGTGGQGVITIGYVLAQAASQKYHYITRFPIYMGAMRGMAALCTVIFSDEEIAAPILSRYDNAITMESGTFGRFEKGINPGGNLVYNSSLIEIPEAKAEKLKCKLYGVPVTDMAQDMKAPFLANMIMLGAYREISGVLSEELVKGAMEYILTTEGKGDRLEINVKAYDRGAAFAREQSW